MEGFGVANGDYAMTARYLVLVTSCATLLLAGAACKPNGSSVFPLTLQTVEQLNPINTGSLSYEEKGGEIFVSVTDKHGDSHYHQLTYDGATKQHALGVLEQKRTELQTRAGGRANSGSSSPRNDGAQPPSAPE
jgi:hypothetical protein